MSSELGTKRSRIVVTNFGRMNGTGNEAEKPQFSGTLHFDAVNPEAAPLLLIVNSSNAPSNSLTSRWTSFVGGKGGGAGAVGI